MSTPLFLSRATLRHNVPASALRALLAPDDHSARAGAGHKVVWTLFADSPDRVRDFLWREVEGGMYYLLSHREPVDRHGLFDVEDPKPFAPQLRPGDRLSFSLRANATVARKSEEGQKRGKPCDVVMNALYLIPRGARAELRHDAVTAAGSAWLASVGSRAGFVVEGGTGSSLAAPFVTVVAYRALHVEHAGPKARLGVLDFEGELEVRDPALFVESLVRGFGRAKAFGNGLMLIRRA